MNVVVILFHTVPRAKSKKHSKKAKHYRHFSGNKQEGIIDKTNKTYKYIIFIHQGHNSKHIHLY